MTSHRGHQSHPPSQNNDRSPRSPSTACDLVLVTSLFAILLGLFLPIILPSAPPAQPPKRIDPTTYYVCHTLANLRRLAPASALHMMPLPPEVLDLDTTTDPFVPLENIAFNGAPKYDLMEALIIASWAEKSERWWDLLGHEEKPRRYTKSGTSSPAKDHDYTTGANPYSDPDYTASLWIRALSSSASMFIDDDARMYYLIKVQPKLAVSEGQRKTWSLLGRSRNTETVALTEEQRLERYKVLADMCGWD